MPLLATAEEVILADINQKHGLDLKPADITFGEPRAPATSDEITAANGRNTMVRIQALATANAIGSTFIYYDRVDFADMYTDPDGIEPLRVPARLDSVFTSHDIVPLINQYYGLRLRPSDVVSVAIDRDTWRVELEADPLSLGWVGKQTVQLLPGDALLPSNFDSMTLDAYQYPYFNTRVGQAAVYSYPWRFDDYAAELKAAGTNLTLTRLGQILKTVTGDNWIVYRNPVDFNLTEAVISYNGKNSYDFPTKPSVDNVMVVDLSLYCLNLGGRLYLQYNDPD